MSSSSHVEQDITRYLKKILELEVCYESSEKVTGLIFILNLISLFRTHHSATQLKQVAQNLKMTAKTKLKHQIAMYVAADSICYLTNDFLLREDYPERRIALKNAVSELRDVIQPRVNKLLMTEYPESHLVL